MFVFKWDKACKEELNVLLALGQQNCCLFGDCTSIKVLAPVMSQRSAVRCFSSIHQKQMSLETLVQLGNCRELLHCYCDGNVLSPWGCPWDPEDLRERWLCFNQGSLIAAREQQNHRLCFIFCP